MDSVIDISFIVPCHNLENYIKPLLCSLHALNLDQLKYEFIFVLDDCQDKTKEVIETYMANLPTTILECKVHSCGLARNEGLEIARGEYIWFLDGDDWIIYPNVLQDVLPVIKSKSLNLVKVKYISNSFNKQCDNMVWQYIYRRSFIGDTRFTAVQPHEDLDFNRIVIKDQTEVFVYNIPTYFYNYNRPGSNMTKYRKQKSEISVMEI